MQERPSDQKAIESPPKKPFYNKPWFIVLAVVAGIVLVAVPLLTFIMGLGSSGSAPEAKELFYSMMETTAQKSKVRYAYERTRPQVGDTDPLHVKSLAEYDYANKKYSTVFASESIIAQADRCVDGKEYINPDIKYPRDFAQAEEALRGKSQESSQRFPTGACDFMEVRYQGNFTDGILPVGANAEQAKGMVDELRLRDAIALKDEGAAVHKGKKGRKISFVLDEKATGRPYKADVFFYTFRDGGTNKVAGNNIDLDNINAQFSVRLRETYGIKGFYLIDEKVKLPIYSEVVTLGSGANFAPDTALSTYEYPEIFTIGPDTQLPDIGKPEKN